jgi:hypothetical protein
MRDSTLRRGLTLARREDGAIGWLMLGILVGIGLVIYGVYELVT